MLHKQVEGSFLFLYHNNMKLDYDFKKDVESVINVKGINVDSFCIKSNIPKRTLFYAFSHDPSNTVLESAYSCIYDLGVRLNKTKSELFEELKSKSEIVLYHGSKYGIKELTYDGFREDYDFGKGFYLSKSLSSAASFVNSQKSSSIYAFKLNLEDLNIYEFECDLDWMLVISLNRKKIEKYKDNKIIQNILEKINKADVLIGPIADNKMFEVMSKFSNGEITTVEAIHALSASRLGKQYVVKSQKALDKLTFLDRLYLCNDEKKESLRESKEEELIIQNKLDFAKREFRGQGQFIDEVLKWEYLIENVANYVLTKQTFFLNHSKCCSAHQRFFWEDSFILTLLLS